MTTKPPRTKENTLVDMTIAEYEAKHGSIEDSQEPVAYGVRQIGADHIQYFTRTQAAAVSAMGAAKNLEVVGLNIRQPSAVQGHLTTPNTYGGFQASFYVEHKRNPTPQEVFDAGVRSGQKLGAAQEVPANKVAVIGNRPSELMGTWIVNDLVSAVQGVPQVQESELREAAKDAQGILHFMEPTIKVSQSYIDTTISRLSDALYGPGTARSNAPHLEEKG